MVRNITTMISLFDLTESVHYSTSYDDDLLNLFDFGGWRFLSFIIFFYLEIIKNNVQNLALYRTKKGFRRGPSKYFLFLPNHILKIYFGPIGRFFCCCLDIINNC